jgi:ubiquinone/menaquinone biosynthesis C-methylase UbiE
MTDSQRTARHFSRHAEAYAESPGHARGGDLDIVIAYCEVGPEDRCLDIATGAGHTALRLAASAAEVIGLDVAEGMLETARGLAAERALDNLSFRLGDAAALPFAAESFDLATCRIAPHHFADIPAFLAETARVLKPGGRFVLEDTLAPDDPAAAAFIEEIERRRDPTHLHALSQSQWHAAISAAGLRVVRETIFEKQHPFPAWLARVGIAGAAARDLEAEILAAEPPLRDRFFDHADGAITRLKDRKLITRADKPPV